MKPLALLKQKHLLRPSECPGASIRQGIRILLRQIVHDVLCATASRRLRSVMHPTGIPVCSGMHTRVCQWSHNPQTPDSEPCSYLSMGMGMRSITARSPTQARPHELPPGRRKLDPPIPVQLDPPTPVQLEHLHESQHVRCKSKEVLNHSISHAGPTSLFATTAVIEVINPRRYSALPAAPSEHHQHHRRHQHHPPSSSS